MSTSVQELISLRDENILIINSFKSEKEQEVRLVKLHACTLILKFNKINIAKSKNFLLFIIGFILFILHILWLFLSKNTIRIRLKNNINILECIYD